MTRLLVDISKKLDRFTLDVRFEISADRFALLGPSGCGKSMTLKCIAGVERPDKGRIVLGDKVLFDSSSKIDLPPRKRGVGYLFQDNALFPNMTAYENINIIAKDSEKTKSLLKRFDLTDVAGQKPLRLSGGQCQRTAIARMLASDPKIILLDEPFTALDNYLHTRIENEILDILEEFDGPSILVSHDRNEVYRICDTIGVIEMGQLLSVNDKESFFSNPSNVTSARLTGCKNITRIREDGFALDWGIKLPDTSGAELKRYKYAGYRAHYLTVTDISHKGDPGVFEARVVRVIKDTFSTYICFRQNGNNNSSPDSVLTWIISNNRDNSISKDDIIYLKLDGSKIMFFER